MYIYTQLSFSELEEQENAWKGRRDCIKFFYSTYNSYVYIYNITVLWPYSTDFN